MEDSVGPGVDPDRRDVAPAHDAFAVDHEQGALAGAVLLAVDAVGPRDRALGLEVGEQREVEGPVLRKRKGRPDAVDRDSQQLRAVTLELRQQLLVERQLVGADRAPVLRIEDQDCRPAAAVGERDLLVRGRGQREVRRRRSGRQRHRLLRRARHGTIVCRPPNGMTRRADRGVYSRQGPQPRTWGGRAELAGTEDLDQGATRRAYDAARKEAAMSTAVETATDFRVGLPQDKIADLRRRISATRWPSKELVDDRSQGVQLATLKALADYWRS